MKRSGGTFAVAINDTIWLGSGHAGPCQVYDTQGSLSKHPTTPGGEARTEDMTSFSNITFIERGQTSSVRWRKIVLTINKMFTLTYRGWSLYIKSLRQRVRPEPRRYCVCQYACVTCIAPHVVAELRAGKGCICLKAAARSMLGPGKADAGFI